MITLKIFLRKQENFEERYDSGIVDLIGGLILFPISLGVYSSW